jgi:TetR/AcrR family tetracycline transcriptional repressor
MGEDEEKRSSLSRGRLVAVALDLVQQEGLEALTMRGLADRMGVKAASLYWHVRDRAELVELLAQALLAEVRSPGTRADWRAEALAVCSALERLTRRRRDAARLFLEVPEALERSEAHARLQRVLEGAGLPAGDAREAATMMLVHVLVAATRGDGDEATGDSGRIASVAVDTGSRGVTLRAGSDMSGLIRAAHDPTAPAPAIVRGDTVIVRRLRGGRQGELELNPVHPWRFRVQAPTWNTVLDLAGLDVRGIHIDSGATRVECILPPPTGVVPIQISGGVVGVRLRRPPGVAVVAEVSTAAVRLRLDAFTIAATTGDVTWESTPGARHQDHYLLRISGGAVRVSLEEDASISAERPHRGAAVVAPAGVMAALNLVLDGVASRK